VLSGESSANGKLEKEEAKGRVEYDLFQMAIEGWRKNDLSNGSSKAESCRENAVTRSESRPVARKRKLQTLTENLVTEDGVCRACSKKFSALRSAQSHAYQMHVLADPAVSTVLASDRGSGGEEAAEVQSECKRCSLCDRVFTSIDAKKQHDRSKHSMMNDSVTAATASVTDFCMAFSSASLPVTVWPGLQPSPITT
jgi:predicted DCC family thiol-disulfide oxidoreductase YuxK